MLSTQLAARLPKQLVAPVAVHRMHRTTLEAGTCCSLRTCTPNALKDALPTPPEQDRALGLSSEELIRVSSGHGRAIAPPCYFKSVGDPVAKEWHPQVTLKALT